MSRSVLILSLVRKEVKVEMIWYSMKEERRQTRRRWRRLRMMKDVPKQSEKIAVLACALRSSS